MWWKIYHHTLAGARPAIRNEKGQITQSTENFRETGSRDRHARESASAVANTIGIGSGKQWDKLKYVAEHKPELLATINPPVGLDKVVVRPVWPDPFSD